MQSDIDCDFAAFSLSVLANSWLGELLDIVLPRAELRPNEVTSWI